MWSRSMRPVRLVQEQSTARNPPLVVSHAGIITASGENPSVLTPIVQYVELESEIDRGCIG